MVGRARIGTRPRLVWATTATTGAIPSSMADTQARRPTPWRTRPSAGVPPASTSTASTSRLLTTKKARAAAAKAGSDTWPGWSPGGPGSPPASE